MTARIEVGDGSPASPRYAVLVGRGLLADGGSAVHGLLPPGVARVLIVHPESMEQRAAVLAAGLRERGLTVHLGLVPDAEAAKTATVAAQLWQQLGLAGFTRSDAVIGLGGGTVTDLAGFVAATWLRGVAVVQVPTTLLAMVDAAVGGKTGINTAEGKNLVGAFHPPVGVICDLDTLTTLPRADLVAGMAEVVKHGFIRDQRTLDLIAADPTTACDPSGPVLAELVTRSIEVKAAVVTEDLREAGLREILNYGHTFGHAIEQVEDYRWRHGEAVSVGMVFAAELACLAGLLTEAEVAEHRRILAAVGLPTAYRIGPEVDREARWAALATAMGRDKKARGSTLRFVVLAGLGQPQRLAGPSDDLLRAAFDRVI